MEYRSLFDDRQAAAAICHTAGLAVRRETIVVGPHIFALAYTNDANSVVIYAAEDSRRVVVFDHDTKVFDVSRTGEIKFYQRGPWELAVELIVSETKRAGLLDQLEIDRYLSETSRALHEAAPLHEEEDDEDRRAVLCPVTGGLLHYCRHACRCEVAV